MDEKISVDELLCTARILENACEDPIWKAFDILHFLRVGEDIDKDEIRKAAKDLVTVFHNVSAMVTVAYELATAYECLQQKLEQESFSDETWKE